MGSFFLIFRVGCKVFRFQARHKRNAEGAEWRFS